MNASGAMNFWHVDAHVHLHPSQLSAARIAALASAGLPVDDQERAATAAQVWCLADMAGVETLETLAAPSFQQELRSMSDVRTEQRSGQLEISTASWRVALIDGEQVVSAEGLELLTVGGKLRPTRSEPIATLIERSLAEGFVPILPWGVGKWFMARGRVIADLLAKSQLAGRLALADSGTRPAGWPRPSLLERASDRGFAVLHGSDSLRVAGDQARTGRFGFRLPVSNDGDFVGDLKESVRSASPLTYFGSPISPWHFLRSQILLRLG
ncbi:MAG: hypothetical protein AAFX44_17840 [Pseudomonadota bacterium]